MPDWDDLRERARMVWQALERSLSPLARPRSLSRQMAIVAVAITIGAIVATGIIASIAVSNSFSQYLKSELHQTAQTEAIRISASYQSPEGGGDFARAVDFTLLTKVLQDTGNDANVQIWVSDAQGNILFPVTNVNAVWQTNDPTIVVPALRHTLLTGDTAEGDLPDTSQAWLHFSARAFAVAPVVVNSDNGTSTIIGAVGVSSERGLNTGGPGFIQAVDRALLGGGLAIALVVALLGAFLARRITQPLDRLTGAAAKMAAGDLSARVELPEHELPIEITQLADTFNEMAVKLEHDVAELRRLEKLQRELVANVAHELATPLTAIRGFAEALADEVATDGPEREEISRIIQRETIRLQGLVNQLRQVARLEAGTEEMDFQPLSLPNLAQDTLDVLQSEIARREVTVQQLIPADLPLVLADADRLTQVLLNLFDNAMRYTPQGGYITVTAEPVGDFVEVAVADSGNGIAPEHVSHVFERFYRVEKSRNRATGGSGLGLAIVKAIVEAHGGQIRAENAPDGGARFVFTLRRAPEPEPAAVEPTDSMPEAEPVNL